ncbi:MAG: tRNA lysidine(34) synthetase TilS [Ruminococcaceae bacterium]|nr:tRNA lysidine(34) synthetase TilS [Oscillospiraceae bacterium]
MLNKLLKQLRQYDMVAKGDRVICAVSGGADSVALLFGMYLLREKLGITLSAAHFNHRLRGEESDRDEQFVRSFCDRYDIPLEVGSTQVVAGKKGLEAAARDARYAFFATLPGKIATAHTADDNAETVLMHLVRGTGLRGLGGISPVNGNVIRPMLTVTRQEVLAFLEEYCLDFVEDSSNKTDDFLRNRLRHHVMPLLKEENPRLAENLSDMAMELRWDAQALEALDTCQDVSRLREMMPALRSRALYRFLKENGIREPERSHVHALEALVFSEKPSARVNFPGGVTVGRNYDRLEVLQDTPVPEAVVLMPGDRLELPQWGLTVSCEEAREIINTKDIFTVNTASAVMLRSRQAGDSMRLNVGTCTLKKLFIDRKVPAHQRPHIPVLVDEQGVLGVWGIGANVDRLATTLPAVQIRLEPFMKQR